MSALRIPTALIVGTLLGASPVRGDEPKPPAASSLHEAVDAMLSVRDSEAALNAAIAAARKLGATDQAILEARFLFHVDRREDQKLVGLLPTMLEQKKKFRLSESRIFAVEEDFMAVVEYVHAVDCLLKDDRVGFKKHITEAFWLSPGQGAAFAPHIERLRLNEAMAKVRVDFKLELPDLEGRPTTLADLSKGGEAVLLHFFSPWSQECADSMPDLIAVTKELQKHGIAVVNIVGEPDDEALADTRELLLAMQDPAPGAWLADHADKPMSRLLRIQSAPTVVLVRADGEVIFNGHPADDGLWQELVAIAPDCKRPALTEQGP